MGQRDRLGYNSRFSMKDYYKILGVKRNSSQEEINKAYRNLVLKYHPDKNHDKDTADKFKEIQESYEFLKSSKPVFSFNTKNSVDDVFDNLFSRIFGNQKNNSSSKVRLKINLEESYRGCEKTVEIEKNKFCNKCSGTGGLSWDSCEKCKGKGFVYDDDSIVIQASCAYCDGKGNIISKKCDNCKGNGFFIDGKKNVLLNIPAGILDETQIRLSEENFGDDLYVVVNVQKDIFFERKENDLICSLEVPYHVLVFGGDIDLSVFRERIKLKIKPRTKTGSKIFVKGLGFPSLDQKSRGNLQVNIQLKLPDKMTKEHKELIEKLKNF